jgi:hypothetical protein
MKFHLAHHGAFQLDAERRLHCVDRASQAQPALAGMTAQDGQIISPRELLKALEIRLVRAVTRREFVAS